MYQQQQPQQVYQQQQPQYQAPMQAQQPVVVAQPVVIQQAPQVAVVVIPRGNHPCVAKCGLCGTVATTHVTKESGGKFWGMFLIGCLIPPLCCCVPLFDGAYDHVHKCSQCHSVLATDTNC